MTIGDDDYIIAECILHSEVLRYRTRGLLHSEAEKVVSDLLDKAWEQVCRDALVGTYSDYTKTLFPSDSAATQVGLEKTARDAARIKPEFKIADLSAGALQFRLELQSKWFREPRIGLQHLVHVLCGDIFGRALSGIGAVEVKSLDLGQLGEAFDRHYRPLSHDIDAIRALFALNNAPLLYGPGQHADLPLLGFSLKPRNGLDEENFKQIALGVLRAGFNLVEADVRNVDFMSAGWRSVFAEVAAEAARITSHVARFSLTLSGPADLAIKFAEEFHAAHPAGGPWVVKVDGGLDGLSTVQALREHFRDAQPVITSYPVLGDVLAGRIGEGTFRDMLVLSGVDIIYPGGAPRIGEGEFVDFESAERGVRRYKKMIETRWPMPSIAGGVFAGQLPAYYEMLGPDTAYFPGGGVALHLNGAFYLPATGWFDRSKPPTLDKVIRVGQRVGGAELCRYAVEAAAVIRDPATLKDRLAYTQEHYLKAKEGEDSGSRYGFVDPKNVLKGSIRSFRKEDDRGNSS